MAPQINECAENTGHSAGKKYSEAKVDKARSKTRLNLWLVFASGVVEPGRRGPL